MIPGLCADCRHAKRLSTKSGNTLWMCGLAAEDESFPRYPRLPVLSCPGYRSHPKP